MTLRKIFSDMKKFDISRLEQEIVLSFVLGEKREYLYSHDDRELSDAEYRKFQAFLQKLQDRYPLAYIIHEKEFYGRKFFVDERVLIPRPETEEMVDWLKSGIWNLKSEMKFQKNSKHQISNDKRQTMNVQRVLDLGTGSGCIPITLALEGFTNVYASDISHDALEVAKMNSQHLSARVEFRCGNLLEPWKEEEIDVLIANLPYVEEVVRDQKSEIRNQNVQNLELKGQSSDLLFEPELALFAGEDGLDVYRELLLQLKKRKQLPEFFMFEAGMENTALLCGLCNDQLPNISWEVKKDLGGKERFVIGWRR